jgi:hypothetical protein
VTAETEGLTLLIGKSPISRFLFGTPAKRWMIPRLREQGWPIFLIDGHPAARPSQLIAEVIERERSARANCNTTADSNPSSEIEETI